MGFALLFSRHGFLVWVVTFGVLAVDFDAAFGEGGAVGFGFFEGYFGEFLEGGEDLFFGVGVDLDAQLQVLCQVQITLVLRLSVHLALLELLVYLHSYIRGEQSTSHSFRQLLKNLLVLRLTGSLAIRVLHFGDLFFVTFLILAELLGEVNCYDVESDVGFAHLADHFLVAGVRGSLTISDQENSLLYLLGTATRLQHLKGYCQPIDKVTALLLDFALVHRDLIKVAEEFEVDLEQSPF